MNPLFVYLIELFKNINKVCIIRFLSFIKIKSETDIILLIIYNYNPFSKQYCENKSYIS